MKTSRWIGAMCSAAAIVIAGGTVSWFGAGDHRRRRRGAERELRLGRQRSVGMASKDLN
jgi:hypothetical protein